MAKYHRKRSKRVTLKLKYKIVKKVASHNRKERRNSMASSKRLKDIGIPNSIPFKEEILQEVEKRKMQGKQLKDAKQKRLRESEMVADASSREAQFHPVESPHQTENCPNSKTYFKDVKTVVEDADVILHVLDARDPLGTRSPQIEDLVIRSGKKLVLVLNKIDLIPKDNLQQWLKYLRLFLPTVAFKASTQKQSSNLSQSKTAAIHINESLQTSSCCIGASFLMKLLGNYCRNEKIQTFIKIGVVGMPNVGKSSVINSLKRSRSCEVGAKAGMTKSVQEVSLSKHIKIIDSPGVVFAKAGSPAMLALRNAVNLDSLGDLTTIADTIIQKVGITQMCLFYTVPEFSTSSELLLMLTKRMGRFKRGGVPNCEDGARRLINDWTRGSIKYFTYPPESFIPEAHLEVKIVKELSKSFDISAFEEQELDKSHGSQCVGAKPTENVTSFAKNEEQIAGSFVSRYVVAKPAAVLPTKHTRVKPSKAEELQQNKIIKKKFKKMQKDRKRAKKSRKCYHGSRIIKYFHWNEW